MNTHLSRKLFAKAQRLLPGGVDSPVRAFRAVGGEPLFMQRGLGCRIWDVDGNEFIDYVCSWGPLILGHAHPKIAAALREAVGRGTSFGAPTAQEVALAELIAEAMPSVEMVRFVNSGTEAVMSALRLARAYTGRDTVVKFDGCYHGHVDTLLVQAGSGLLTLGIPASAGVPSALTLHTLSLPYNDLERLQDLFEGHGGEIAAVIVEPVAGNMGVVPPAEGFLEGLRQFCTGYGALLIFDEVITGFRVAYGGAQELYGVRPDLTCLGKIIGGGLPVGAYGGRREIMELVAPAGPVYQAGTLSGNPLAMTAGIETLKPLREPGTYERLEELGSDLASGLEEAAAAAGVPLRCNRVGSLLTAFFTERPMVDYTSARASDTARYAAFFHAMLACGVYLPPSQFEAMFVSLAHTDQDIARTVEVAQQALSQVPGDSPPMEKGS